MAGLASAPQFGQRGISEVMRQLDSSIFGINESRIARRPVKARRIWGAAHARVPGVQPQLQKVHAAGRRRVPRPRVMQPCGGNAVELKRRVRLAQLVARHDFRGHKVRLRVGGVAPAGARRRRDANAGGWGRNARRSRLASAVGSAAAAAAAARSSSKAG